MASLASHYSTHHGPAHCGCAYHGCAYHGLHVPRLHSPWPVFFNQTQRARAVLTAWAEAMAWPANQRAPDDQVFDIGEI